MKTLTRFLLTFLCLLGSKQLLIAQTDCDNVTSGNVPITEIGTGFFMGYQGGLYPGGSNNIPPAHLLAGRNMGNTIKPLNAEGAVDMDNGKIVFVAFGASTAGNTFNTFKATVNSTPDIYNPCLKFVNLCMGGKGLETMIPPQHDWYWAQIADTLMEDFEVTAEQVQIGWIKTASKDDSIPEFPMQADSIYDKYIPSIQRIKENFPNIRILYISSHAYGGYAGELSDNADLAGEPAAYYGGFAVKWVIEDQIEGSPELDYTGVDAVSPWLAWGPYFWADGLTPRAADGLIWECEDYEPDGGGFHLSESGKTKESEMLIDFLYNHPSSKKWFRNGPKWSSCDPAGRLADGSIIENDSETDYFEDALTIYPSPNDGNFYVSWNNIIAGNCLLQLANSQGQVIYNKTLQLAEGDVNQHISLPNLPSGIYFINVMANNTRLTKTLTIK